jgi:hypothetical protein
MLERVQVVAVMVAEMIQTEEMMITEVVVV